MFLLVFLLNIALAGEAEDKAIEAAYIQTGLKRYTDLMNDYVSNNYINKSPILRNGSGLYMIYRNRCLRFEYGPTRSEVGLDTSKVEWVIKL